MSKKFLHTCVSWMPENNIFRTSGPSDTILHDDDKLGPHDVGCNGSCQPKKDAWCGSCHMVIEKNDIKKIPHQDGTTP